jgi:hypothetical protein
LIQYVTRACGKIGGYLGELERLFSVYKVEDGTRILLGGLVERRKSIGGLAERRKSRRRKSNRGGLVELAKRKFAESPDEDIKIFLMEEK